MTEAPRREVFWSVISELTFLNSKLGFCIKPNAILKLEWLSESVEIKSKFAGIPLVELILAWL